MVPEWQGTGIDSYIIGECRKIVQKPNQLYLEYEMQWIGDFNPKMRALHESVGAVLAKTHYTYRCLFSHTNDFKRSTEIARNTKEKAISDKTE